MSATQLKINILSQEQVLNYLNKLREERKISPEEIIRKVRQKEKAKRLRKQLWGKKQAFRQRVNLYIDQIHKIIEFKQPLLEDLSDQVQQFVHASKIQVKVLQKLTVQTKKAILDQKDWLKNAWEILQYEIEDEIHEVGIFEQHAVECCEFFDELIDNFIETINDREERKIKVRQFIKKIRRPAISIKTPQPVLKKPQHLPDSIRPQIEFLPENKELIFNIWTFEGQIIQFILFFDPDSKKFGLKNPSKTFQSLDVNAVRAFNFHKNISEFYEELCLLVVQFIDDVDDLPVYEGK